MTINKNNSTEAKQSFASLAIQKNRSNSKSGMKNFSKKSKIKKNQTFFFTFLHTFFVQKYVLSLLVNI